MRAEGLACETVKELWHPTQVPELCTLHLIFFPTSGMSATSRISAMGCMSGVGEMEGLEGMGEMRGIGGIGGMSKIRGMGGMDSEF